MKLKFIWLKYAYIIIDTIFMRLQICILIPDCIFKEEKVEELLIQSRPSKLGIIKGHVSLIITIDISIKFFIVTCMRKY